MTVSGKLALFIDGASLYATAKALGFDIDFKRLLSEFASRGTLVRAHYYTTIMEGNEFQAMRPLTDWLDFNGFAVKAKPAKEYDDGLAAGRSNETSASSSASMRWKFQVTSITFCCSPATATSVAWSKQFNAAAPL